jgi:hypothetical protein
LNRPGDRAAGLRRWRVHLILVALIGVQLSTWAVMHRTEEEILAAWENGTTRERLDAFHVMANRGPLDPARFDERFVRELLGDPDTLIKELAFTNEVCKFHIPELQTRYVYDFSGGDMAHAWRSYVLHRRKVGGTFVVGGGVRLQWQEAQWFLDATRGRAIDERAVERHLINLMNRINRRQQLLSDDRDP